MQISTLAVILVAAGNANRFQAGRPAAEDPLLRKKPFVPLAGKPVFQHSLEQFAAIDAVRQIILIAAPDDRLAVRQRYGSILSRWDVELVAGGKERYQSVENGLAAVRDGIEYVAIHDAARPCITCSLIEAVLKQAVQTGGAIPASRLVGTIKRQASNPSADSSVIETTVSRDGLWEAQTPQIFRLDWYRQAAAQRGDFSPTDDASLLERLGKPVALVESDRTNLKVTTAGDLSLAEMILAVRR